MMEEIVKESMKGDNEEEGGRCPTRAVWRIRGCVYVSMMWIFGLSAKGTLTEESDSDLGPFIMINIYCQGMIKNE